MQVLTLQAESGKEEREHGLITENVSTYLVPKEEARGWWAVMIETEIQVHTL
jgi:hypothetical protein